MEVLLRKVERLLRRQSKLSLAVVTIFAVTLVTKVLGFWKLRLIAGKFGASVELDTYFAANALPDMLFQLVMAGSISTAVIPLLGKRLAQRRRKHMNTVFKEFVIIFTFIFLVLGLILIIAAKPIAEFFINRANMGIIVDEVKSYDVSLMIRLIRIFALVPMILSFSNLISAYLQVYRRFFVSSLSYLFFNIGVVISIYISQLFSTPIIVLAWGSVLGAIMHLSIQLNTFRKLGGRIDFSLPPKWYSLKYLSFHALPRMISLLSEQVVLFYATVISLQLGTGALSAFKLALSLYMHPVSLIGNSIAQAILPSISHYVGKKDYKKLGEVLRNVLQYTLFLTLPIMAIMLILRLPIVRIMLGSGRFDWTDTISTSWILALLSMSVVAYSLLLIILRVMYVLDQVKQTVVVSIIVAGLNLVFNTIFVNFFSHYYEWRDMISDLQMHGFVEIFKWFTTRNSSFASVGGLGLAISVSNVLELIILSSILNKYIHYLTKSFVKKIYNKVGAVIAMIFALYVSLHLLDDVINTTKTISVLILVMISSLVGVGTYIISLAILHDEIITKMKLKIKKSLAFIKP